MLSLLEKTRRLTAHLGADLSTLTLAQLDNIIRDKKTKKQQLETEKEPHRLASIAWGRIHDIEKQIKNAKLEIDALNKRISSYQEAITKIPTPGIASSVATGTNTRLYNEIAALTEEINRYDKRAKYLRDIAVNAQDLEPQIARLKREAQQLHEKALSTVQSAGTKSAYDTAAEESRQAQEIDAMVMQLEERLARLRAGAQD